MKRKLVIACLIPLLAAIPIVLELRAEDESRHATASGSGTIEGTMIRLSSRASGRVLAVTRERGAVVEAGELLVSLDCDDALLYEFVAEGMTVLLSPPYVEEAARCHRVGLMHKGHLLIASARFRTGST